MANFLHRVVLASILCAGLTAAPGNAAAPAGFDSAVADYNAKKLSAALSKLTAISQANPNHAQTHYYMALCYQGTNQIQLAQREYKWLYANSKDASLRYNSYLALAQIQRWSAKRNYSGQGNVYKHMQAKAHRHATVSNAKGKGGKDCDASGVT